MKLIKTFNGEYINSEFIESYAVREYKSSCDIVAYAPSYGGDCECYKLASYKTRKEAQEQLDAFAEWLANGSLDIMHIWESDDE